MANLYTVEYSPTTNQIVKSGLGMTASLLGTASQAISASWAPGSTGGTSASSSWASSSLTASYISGSILFGGVSDNYVPKWSLGLLTATGSIYDSSSFVGINDPNPVSALSVISAVSGTTNIGINSNIVSYGIGSSNYGVKITAASGFVGPSVNNYGLWVDSANATNNYGIYINSPPIAANNYSLYINTTAKSFFSGSVGIGTSGPQAKVDITATGDTIELLRLSTERAWTFRQVNSGAGTILDLHTLFNNKSFTVSSLNGSASLQIATSDTPSNNTIWLCPNGGSCVIGTNTAPNFILHVAGGIGPSADNLHQMGSETYYWAKHWIRNIQFLNVTTDNNDGLFWYQVGGSSSAAYGLYRTAGAWSGPNYQQLKIEFDTGIILQPAAPDGTSFPKSYVEIAGALGCRISTGSLGVGTLNPLSTLHAKGMIRTTDLGTYSSAGAGLEMYYDTGGTQGIIQTYDRDSAVYRQTQLLGNPLVLNSNGNKVAVGNISPTSTLHVNGDLACGNFTSSATTTAVSKTAQGKYMPIYISGSIFYLQLYQ